MIEYEYSYIKRALLRELSEDSRVSVTTLAKKLRCSRNTIINNLRRLEEELDISYNIEFNKRALGIIHNQVWAVRFGIKPKAEDLAKVFKDDSMVRLVAMTEGDFDLLINMVSQYDEAYINWGIGTAFKMLGYRPIVKPSFIALQHTGSIPISTETLMEFDFSKINLDQVDKMLLIELNGNSRLNNAQLAKKLRQSPETIRYRMKKISKTGIINRYTITIGRPPAGNITAFFMNYEFSPGLPERVERAKSHYFSMDGRLPVVNAFQYLALCSGSYILFGIACSENDEAAIKSVILAHKEIYREDNPEIATAKITRVIKGRIPLRNIDIAKDYNPIKWDLIKKSISQHSRMPAHREAPTISPG